MWVAGVIALSPCLLAADAQNAGSYNAQEVFSTPRVESVFYNRSAALLPLHFNLYGIPVSSNYSRPNVLVTVSADSGGRGVELYCNPNFDALSANSSISYPAPGNALWYSDLTTSVNQIFISKNDPGYPLQLNASFACSVMNVDPAATIAYHISAALLVSNQTLLKQEQTVLQSLYDRCCAASGSCTVWKSQKSSSGAVNTDFCSFPGQICSPKGNLYRLDLSNYSLSCDWPGDLLSQFSQLSTLNLGGNPSLRGNTSSVFGTVGKLSSLQFLDISGDSGIKGPIDSGTANSELCGAAKANLISLKLSSSGLTGSIPDCLYSRGSSVIFLDLSSNNFTGSIMDAIPVDSTLQLFHFSRNQVSGQLPLSLGNAVSFKDLDATNNKLTGTIPAEIGSIATLDNFVVPNNSLTGPIPDSFGTALSLQIFDAKQNQLTALPAAWTNPSFNASNSSYVTVRVSYNNISGPFPIGLVSAPSLVFLILNVNNFSGQLPAEDGMFASLRAFNVSSNQLTGPIPEEWGQTALFSTTPVFLEDGSVLLETFDVSYNRLNGSLPTFLANSVVPAWLKPNVHLEGNQLNVNCSSNDFSYLPVLCATSPIPSPSSKLAPPPPRPASQSPPPPRSMPPPPLAPRGVSAPPSISGGSPALDVRGVTG